MDTIGFVAKTDPELAAAMGRELQRQRQNIELIASENIVSPAVMAAMGTVLTNKYAEGYPGRRYYGGCARTRWKKHTVSAAGNRWRTRRSGWKIACGGCSRQPAPNGCAGIWRTSWPFF